MNRIFVTIICFSVLISPGYAADRPILEDARLYEIYQRASELRDMGRYEDALTLFTYLYKKNPKDIYIKNYIRKIREEKELSEKQWNKKIVEESIDKKQKTLKEHLIDGENHFRREEYDRSMLAFQEALSLEPDNKKANSFVEKIKAYYKEQFEITRLMEEEEEESIDLSEAYPDMDDFIAESIMQTAMRDDSFSGASLSFEEKIDRMIFSSEGRISHIRFNQTTKTDYAAEDLDLLSNRELKEMAERNIKQKHIQEILSDAELEQKIDMIVERIRKEKTEQNFDYTLGPEDVLQINVRDHPELSGKVEIGRKGEVILPLTNDIVYIGDMTKEEALDEIVKSITSYVENPYVQVEIEEYNSKKYYVIREGSTPRRIALTRMDLTLYDVLLDESIDYTDDLKRVRIMQPHMRNPTYRVVNAHSLIYKGQMQNNIFIRPNDMVYIPKTFMHQTGVNMQQFLDPLVKIYNQAQRGGQNLSDIKGGIGFGGPTERIGATEAKKGDNSVR